MGSSTSSRTSIPRRIESIYLFASRRKGTAIPTSDIDIAVVTDMGDPSNLKESSQARLQELGFDSVDFSIMQRAELLPTGHYGIEHSRQYWHYLVPADPEQRSLLRESCEGFVFPERHYLDYQTAERSRFAGLADQQDVRRSNSDSIITTATTAR